MSGDASAYAKAYGVEITNFVDLNSSLRLQYRGGKAWELTSTHYLMKDGGVQPSTMHDNPQNTWPETTVDGSVVDYPLRTTAAIDYLLLGDLIFRYSQDKIWLEKNIPLLRRTAPQAASRSLR
jgi:hypothetical protein